MLILYLVSVHSLQTLNQMYIVNAGSGFKLVWNTARGFLDPKTTAKIHVCNLFFLKTTLHLLDFKGPEPVHKCLFTDPTGVGE